MNVKDVKELTSADLEHYELRAVAQAVRPIRLNAYGAATDQRRRKHARVW